MKSILKGLLLCVLLYSSGCIQHTKVEQRAVELPDGYPNRTLDTAAHIGNALVASGLAVDIQKRFPNLNQQNLQGLYLTWNAGNFQGRQSVFFLTGIRYTGELPEAKAVADYCEARVKKAVVEKLLPTAKSGKVDFPNGDSALVFEYQTSIPIENKVALRKEVDWIWDALKWYVEDAKLKTGVIRATHPEGGAGLVTESKGYGFVFTKREDGQWQCLQDEKK